MSRSCDGHKGRCGRHARGRRYSHDRRWLVTGRNHVVIDMSVDTTTFTASSEYSVRLSGSSAVSGTSVVGIVVGEWSVENRSVTVDANGRIQVQPGTGAGQVSITSGIVAANTQQIAGQTASAAGAVTFPGSIMASGNVTVGAYATAKIPRACCSSRLPTSWQQTVAGVSSCNRHSWCDNSQRDHSRQRHRCGGRATVRG